MTFIILVESGTNGSAQTSSLPLELRYLPSGYLLDFWESDLSNEQQLKRDGTKAQACSQCKPCRAIQFQVIVIVIWALFTREPSERSFSKRCIRLKDLKLAKIARQQGSISSSEWQLIMEDAPTVMVAALIDSKDSPIVRNRRRQGGLQSKLGGCQLHQLLCSCHGKNLRFFE